MEKTDDRRIRKTKKAVHEALLQLLTEKQLPAITVKELTLRADINRKTFYNHYNDIYAVLDEAENECADRILSFIDPDQLNLFIQKPDLFFSGLLKEVSDNKDFYILLKQSASHSRILSKLIGKEKALLRRLFGDSRMDEIWGEYFLTYVSAGTIAVMDAWLDSRQDIPVSTLGRFFSTLFTSADVERFLEYAAKEDGAGQPRL